MSDEKKSDDDWKVWVSLASILAGLVLGSAWLYERGRRDGLDHAELMVAEREASEAKQALDDARDECKARIARCEKEGDEAIGALKRALEMKP